MPKFNEWKLVGKDTRDGDICFSIRKSLVVTETISLAELQDCWSSDSLIRNAAERLTQQVCDSELRQVNGLLDHLTAIVKEHGDLPKAPLSSFISQARSTQCQDAKLFSESLVGAIESQSKNPCLDSEIKTLNIGRLVRDNSSIFNYLLYPALRNPLDKQKVCEELKSHMIEIVGDTEVKQPLFGMITAFYETLDLLRNSTYEELEDNIKLIDSCLHLLSAVRSMSDITA